MNRRSKLTLVCLIAFSCSKESDKPISASSNSSLSGVWLSPKCQNSGDLSNKSQLEFEGAKMFVWDRNYDGDDCHKEVLRKRMNEFTFEQTNVQWAQTSYQDEEVLVTVASEYIVTANSAKFCENASWLANTPKNVKGKLCVWKFGNTTVSMGTLPEGDFQSEVQTIYYVLTDNKLCWSPDAISSDDLSDTSACWLKESP